MAIDKNQQTGSQMPKQQRSSQDQQGAGYQQAGQRNVEQRADRSADRSTSSTTSKSRRDEDLDSADMDQETEE